MTPKNDAIVDMPINEKARDTIVREADEFATTLVHQSKIMASIDDADAVQSNHVRSAVRLLFAKEKTSWSAELGKIVGGALFGAFLPGFIGAIHPLNLTLLLLFIIGGFVGMLLVFLSLRRLR